VPGLKSLAAHLPCRDCIVDGELHGVIVDFERGPRPADIYQVYGYLRGEKTAPVNLRYTVFDLCYLNGQDLLNRPLTERRKMLEMLLAPMQGRGAELPLPIELSEGRYASNVPELNQLHELYRRQGYEGSIAKAPSSPYVLGDRSAQWMKRKPIVTLDFVVTAAFFAVESSGFRTFNPYLISGFDEKSRLVPVGTCGGLDRAESEEMVRLITTNGLVTGRRLERVGSTGTQPGVELRPFIVVTVKFEAIVDASDSANFVRDQQVAAEYTLRSPQIVHIRANEKEVGEVASTHDLKVLYMKQRN
jgi:DNA ligase-1